MSLKKYDGSAFVNISSLKKYDGSAFVNISSLKKYDGSNWINIFPNLLNLYYLGDECIALTGGWVKGFAYNPANGSRVKNTDNLSISSTNTTTLMFDTVNKVDLTAFTKVYVEWKCSGSGTGNHITGVYISTANNSEVSTVKSIQRADYFTRVIESFDISALSGSYYIQTGLSVNTKTVNTKFYKIWFE